jgi:hypothetical protein
MGIFEQAIQTEALGGTHLFAAYAPMRKLWLDGNRERELTLHLLFLSWYLDLEPAFLTGLQSGTEEAKDLARIFVEAHDWLLPEGERSTDAEALYVAGLLARMWTIPTLPVDVWDARAEAYHVRYRELRPGGLSAAEFERRGYYGEYFAGMTRVKNGY